MSFDDASTVVAVSVAVVIVKGVCIVCRFCLLFTCYRLAIIDVIFVSKQRQQQRHYYDIMYNDQLGMGLV